MFSEDREFVERILAGDMDAFESLVRKYNRMAGAMAFAIVGDFHLAEDVVQESFIKALRALPDLREPEKFRFWFAGLVRSRALDVLRQRRAHPTQALPQDASAESFHPEVLGPEDAEMREELRERILAAVADLPEEDRLVVVLKHMEGLSYKEIAELLGTTVSAVESRLFRARQLLSKQLPKVES